MSYFTADNLTDSMLDLLKEYGSDYERGCVNASRRVWATGGGRTEQAARGDCAMALNGIMAQVKHFRFEEIPFHVYEVAVGRKEEWAEFEMTQEEALKLCMQALKKRGQ
jgi:hypothetical protein